MKHIGLFEGIGGFSLAARWMGWETVAWCEINPFCQRVLKHHFPKAVGHDDITKTDFTIYADKIDILTGGFPCQPYSIAGKRKGTEDARHLWPQMLRAIQEIRPTYVVAENVLGILNWDDGRVFSEICTQMEDEGYEVAAFVLPASAVEAPHERYRVWIVAYCDGKRRRQFNTSKITNREVKHSGLCDEINITNCQSIYDGINIRSSKTRQRSQSGNSTITNNTTNGDSIGREERCKNTKSKESSHCIPDWRSFPAQSPILCGDDGISERLDGCSLPYLRRNSIEAYGNAIVPQVAYNIYRALSIK